MSHIMRKCFCICQNKGADQLQGNHAANQCLFFLHRKEGLNGVPLKSVIIKILAKNQ